MQSATYQYVEQNANYLHTYTSFVAIISPRVSFPKNFIVVTIDLSGEISANLVTLVSRVARWNIFKPKIPMGVNFAGS
jgi:hypothetical protein